MSIKDFNFSFALGAPEDRIIAKGAQLLDCIPNIQYLGYYKVSKLTHSVLQKSKAHQDAGKRFLFEFENYLFCSGENWDGSSNLSISLWTNEYLPNLEFEELKDRFLKHFHLKKITYKKLTKIRFIECDKNGYNLSAYLPFKKQSKSCEDTVSCHYNDDFKDVHETMLAGLKNPNKGLYLLHGVPGSGKTSYIRALSSLIKDRDFIFLPSTYASALSEPSFLSFLSSRCKNSILILEDAEEILKDRSVNRTSAVPSILNLTDGLLGDMLNISLICTFNADDKSIDQALLRKGRAKVNYKFDKLSLEKCQNINPNITQPCSLADALLFEEDSLIVERPIIGFARN